MPLTGQQAAPDNRNLNDPRPSTLSNYWLPTLLERFLLEDAIQVIFRDVKHGVVRR
jgi:hypothetical protein